MGTNTFLVALKSAVDKMAADLAFSLGINYVDLDDSTATAEMFKGDTSAIVLEYNTLTPAPRDPLYSGSLHIGARTVQDPANYEILKLMGMVEDLFPIGARIELRDASGPTLGGVIGVLTPGQVEVMTQQFDLLSGVRLLRVDFKAMRFG